MVVNKYTTRTSVSVPPLLIHKSRSGSREPCSDERPSSSRSEGRLRAAHCESNMTPPATPNGSQKDVCEELDVMRPAFHNFLRAFYPFQPTQAVSDSTVTLPLNEGDVVLVHSIHTNGWADGTLLLTGARGWLPTNYCEGYEPESMSSLLKALLNFWDLMRSGATSDNEIFGSQDYIRGIISGVRSLLERSDCLTRESLLVLSNDGLRRNRKALLAELSSLVKAAKRLQLFTSGPLSADQDIVNDAVDEMILKAFKIVTRGVRFFDVLAEEARLRLPSNTSIATVTDDMNAPPPTPPADTTSFECSASLASAPTSSRTSVRISVNGVSDSQSLEAQAQQQQPHKRFSNNAGTGIGQAIPLTRPSSTQANRHSVSHRVSYAGVSYSVPRENLTSEKLSARHDIFLSYLGSFIGRLHVQSQSSSDLLHTIRQCVSSGRNLLLVIVEVCHRDAHQSAELLKPARDTMYARIAQLVVDARDIIKSANQNDDDVVMPQENRRLMDEATGCVKAAGDCVAKAKFVIERIGDFEFEGKDESLQFDLSGLEVSADDASSRSRKSSLVAEVLDRQSLSPSQLSTREKPLPEVPASVAETTEDSVPVLDSRAPSVTSSESSLLPPLPKFISSFIPPDEHTFTENRDGMESIEPTQSTGSVMPKSCASSFQLGGTRDSETSLVSQTSTRATTPDNSMQSSMQHQPSMSDISMTDSQTLVGELDETESKMLERTYAHEILYNKDGQITGGTLPALIERLTTHDSTPDATFVSTFYLTFRLFVTPVKFAEALVDRFDYIRESPHIAGPVHLRVYNIFKGWLESHWRQLVDLDALAIIADFAQNKLQSVLPAAGRRLYQLTERVSATDSSLVPRLVSSVGKTNMSLTQYVSPETPLPPPIVTKAQTNLLKNWKAGGTCPTILDFDPLELARQLTIKDMNIFCAIMPEELLDAEWMKKSGSIAINVRAMSTLSTDLSNLVADTILHYEEAKKRAFVIKHWIKIAHKCLTLNNYDSLMAIICSLNSSTVLRLKRTWENVSVKRKEMLKSLQAIVEPTRNHAVLRQRMHDHIPPCLPFPGTYLTDLTFNDLGNPSTKQLPGCSASKTSSSDSTQPTTSVINFDKHMRTAKIIGELQRFQIPYRLAEVPELQEWLQAQIVRVKSSDQSSVQKYYRKSLLLEPRVTPISATGMGFSGIMEKKLSPVEAQNTSNLSSGTSGKERFDLFAWTGLKDRGAVAATTTV